MKKYFEKFGKVCYISLPKFEHFFFIIPNFRLAIIKLNSNLIFFGRFKTSNQLKGFAFIEFGTKDEAKKAVEVCINIQIRLIYEV